MTVTVALRPGPSRARAGSPDRTTSRRARARAGAARRLRRPDGTTVALGVFLAFVAFFLLWPTVVVIGHAFTPDGSFGLSAMTEAVSGPFRSPFRNSLVLSAVSAVIGGVLGLLLALAVRDLDRPRGCARRSTRGARSPPSSAACRWPSRSSRRSGTQGVVTKALNALGIDLLGTGFSLSSLAGLVVVYLYFQIPLMFLVVMPAVAGLRDDLARGRDPDGRLAVALLAVGRRAAAGAAGARRRAAAVHQRVQRLRHGLRARLQRSAGPAADPVRAPGQRHHRRAGPRVRAGHLDHRPAADRARADDGAATPRRPVGAA